MSLRERLIDHYRTFAERAQEACIEDARSHSAGPDALAALRRAELVFGVHPTTSILVQMAFAVGRMISLQDYGAAEDEMLDAAIDLANGGIMLIIVLETGRETLPHERFARRVRELWHELLHSLVSALEEQQEEAILRGERAPHRLLRDAVALSQMTLPSLARAKDHGPLLTRGLVFAMATHAAQAAFAAKGIRKGGL
ncbi:MAG: hypothetical protein N3B15_07310 [Planctomycetota bacterium]|nr:hypothetical protein [Planctomycetota bacterium]